MDHTGGEARTRTYDNLLDNAWEEALFDHYFSARLARVGVDGKVRRIEGTTGLLARVQPSPDRKHVLVTRLKRPYSHLLKATHFPRDYEIWDLERGERIDAPALLQQTGITATRGKPLATFFWQYGTQSLGWTERAGGGVERWVALDPPYAGAPREVVSSAEGISSFLS